MAALCGSSRPWWESKHHPGCGCPRIEPAAGEGPPSAPHDPTMECLNWIGPSSEPKRQPAEATAGVPADALLIGGDNYHFLLDSSRGVGYNPTPIALPFPPPRTSSIFGGSGWGE